jgi:hypothetical protein
VDLNFHVLMEIGLETGQLHLLLSVYDDPLTIRGYAFVSDDKESGTSGKSSSQ